ncbi:MULTISPECIES: SusC/RagA family TonB-linked outer membrane protein [unclassified Pedobacter]|uniref:SusC/RagA family TonB-linked outer membrane protein n=1 Tax=unclassified Pedobacter TaxID=2628915 RepID=UPI00142426C5|nr:MULTISPECIES: TonB-dependent receptor [unclassified Pedobacter]NII81182.1 TonB-linked SusC/RagA family outer membrane protein [Pedobacter sp. SG908]NMN35199.1 TonB-linked SusC/RagA family outer membrane protein [Pedobacter sp. SG918]
MKFIKIICLFLLAFTSTRVYAQVRTIRGHIVDEKNIALPGVTVSEEGNLRNGAISDENGDFVITLKSVNNTIRFTMVSYITLTLQADAEKKMAVKMKPDTKGLDDVVVVGYSTQKRITNPGAVSSIKAAEIENIPTSSIQNTLAGRLPGFTAIQRSGQPGSDAAEFFIRGVNSMNNDNQPLIIVDDIQYTYAQVAQLDPNEIETITILKDASTTAIYGVRGANGAMVITTKRGMISKPSINVSTQFGVNQVIQYPNYLDAYATAVLQNEAYINDSYKLASPLTLPWTAADLKMFKDGSDPYGHPNVNWQNELLKNSSTQSNYNVDIRGGNSKVKYFTSFGYFKQNGLLRDFTPTNPDDDGVEPNYFYNRINFRSNLDITPTKTLNIRFDLNGRFETINNPNGPIDAAGLFKELISFRNLSAFSMPIVNPNGTYGYANQSWGNGYVNPISRLANSGYKRNYNNNFNIVAGANQKLDFIAQGLEAKLNVSYASNINEHRNLQRDPATLPAFYYNSANNTYSSKGNNRFPVFSQGIGNDVFNNSVNSQLSLNYDHNFGIHRVYALALVNDISTINGGNVPVNFRGISGRLGYNFRQTYGIEFDVARNGNDLFRKEQRYGFFPSISGFWNLGEEKFFKKLFPFIDLFKFRGSYGLTGSDFGYPTVLTSIAYTLPGSGTIFGNGATEGALVNADVTWEKSRKTDVGVDINMFAGKLTMSADYFYEYRYDQLINQGAISAIIGQAVPRRNVGISDNKGFEVELNYRDKIGAVSYSIGGNLSHFKNKIIYISEAPDYPYLAQTGRQIGLTKGYRFIGFYQASDFDANGSVRSGVAYPLWSTIQPGDMKYADLNGDGFITAADQTFLSQPNIPTYTYGINLGLNYKNFSLRALVQGAWGYAINVFAEGTDIFNGVPQPLHLQSWSPNNPDNAIFPRIGFNNNINNRTWQTISDFSLTPGSYVRLKSLELGFQLPKKWIDKTHFIQNCRIYTAGYNLFTIRDTGKFQVDPEIAQGSNAGTAYPITTNYTFGLQVGF